MSSESVPQLDNESVSQLSSESVPQLDNKSVPQLDNESVSKLDMVAPTVRPFISPFPDYYMAQELIVRLLMEADMQTLCAIHGTSKPFRQSVDAFFEIFRSFIGKNIFDVDSNNDFNKYFLLFTIRMDFRTL